MFKNFVCFTISGGFLLFSQCQVSKCLNIQVSKCPSVQVHVSKCPSVNCPIATKESLGILLAGAKGGLDFEALSSALGSGMFTDVPVKISATELKEQLEREKALRDAIKIDEAKTYLTKNLFTKNGVFATPDEGDEYTDAEIEALLTPLGLNIQKDDDEKVIVYNGNTAVLNLGKDVTKERLELLKTALIAGSEDEIYALFRRSNPDYTYESDVEVEEEFILD